MGDDDHHFVKYHLIKISSGLSVLGSSVVFVEIFNDIFTTRRSGQQQHRSSSGGGVTATTRILLSVSIADILGSVSWFFGTLPSPSDLDYFDGTNHGTYQTCRMQGFVITLGGLSTMLFSGLLAIFYLLMIKYQWRENRMVQLATWTSAMVWSLTLGVAIVPLPLDAYHNNDDLCVISSYPYGCTETWELEEDSGTVTDCTAGDNAAFYRMIITMVVVVGSLLSSVVSFCIIRRTLSKLKRTAASTRSTSKTKRGLSGRTWAASSRTMSQSAPNCHDDDDDDDDNLCQVVDQVGGHGDEDTNDEDDGDGDDDEEMAAESSSKMIMKEGELEQVATQIVTSTQATVDMSLSRSIALVKGQQMIAREGMFYVAGFILIYVPWMISTIVYMITGNYNFALDRAGMFFASLQGLWNMVVFCERRRRHSQHGGGMKTTVGKIVHQLLRLKPCGDCTSYCRGLVVGGGISSAGDSSSSAHDDGSRSEGSGPNNSTTRHEDGLPDAANAAADYSNYTVQWDARQPRIGTVSELGVGIGASHAEEEQSHGCGVVNPDEEEYFPVQVKSSSSKRKLGLPDKDSTPCRPIRTITELSLSGLESIDELSELTPESAVDYTPYRPRRIRSDCELITHEEGNEEDYCSNQDDSLPRRPIRYDSEIEQQLEEEGHCGSNHLPPRQQPRRSETEVGSFMDDNDGTSANGSTDRLPQQPRRLDSEVENLVQQDMKKEEECFSMGEHSSSSKNAASSGVSTTTNSGSSSDSLPHQPLRWESEESCLEEGDDEGSIAQQECYDDAPAPAPETGSTITSRTSLSDSQPRLPCRYASEEFTC